MPDNDTPLYLRFGLDNMLVWIEHIDKANEELVVDFPYWTTAHDLASIFGITPPVFSRRSQVRFLRPPWKKLRGIRTAFNKWYDFPIDILEDTTWKLITGVTERDILILAEVTFNEKIST